MILQQLMTYTVGTFVALFPIANPLGAVPIFYSLTADDSRSYRTRQAKRVAVNVVVVLAVFLVMGRSLLEFFGISLGVLRIAGGLLVAHTAWEMVTARQRLTANESHAAIDKEDISFTPMTIPIVGGPGAIGIVIGISARISHVEEYMGCFLGITGLGIVLYFCLALGEPLIAALGKNELGALNRVLGFFILAIAVQLIADGVFDLLRQSAPGLVR